MLQQNYEKPELIDFGSFQQLTQSGGGSSLDTSLNGSDTGRLGTDLPKGAGEK